MARDEAPMFVRGGTFYQGGTIDSTNLGGVNLEGKEWKFEDTIYGTGMHVICRAVRNSAAIALRPSRLVSFDTAFFGQRVNGYTTTTGAAGYPVDELLPAAGAPVNDVFYIVVQGPAAVLTDIASGAGSVVNAGDLMSALTAATSGATTAGRVFSLDATTTAIALGTELNVIGRAISAATTANTNKSLVVYVHRWL